MTDATHFLKSWFVIFAAFSVSACATGASMRVEVEVYKGPLSKTMVVQEEELHAQLLSAIQTFQGICSKVSNSKGPSSANSACKETSLPQVEEEDSKIDYQRTTPTSVRSCIANCAYSDEMMDDLVWAQAAAHHAASVSWNPPKTANNSVLNAQNLGGTYSDSQLRAIARYGAHLRERATYWGAARDGKTAADSVDRLFMAEMTQFFAEIGNQIVSRSDALLWQRQRNIYLYSQLDPNQRLSIAQRLATGLYLRDSNSTAYQNFYNWNRNTRGWAPPDDRAKLDGHIKNRKLTPVGPDGELSPHARARMVEELMRDTHWSKINTVHASGRGDVKMAFIKDDIGNWNLKEFSNDPEELLEAYSRLTRATVSEAITLATTGGAGNIAQRLPLSERLLGLSNRALAGKNNAAEPKIGDKNVSELSNRIAGRLEEERDKMLADLNPANEKLQAAENDRNAAQAALESAQLQKTTEQSNINRDAPIVFPNLLATDLAGEDKKGACDKARQASADNNAANSNTNGEGATAGTDAAESNEELSGGPQINRDSLPGLVEACTKLVTAIANEKTQTAQVATLSENVTAQKKAVKDIEDAAIKRARTILRDHRAVVATLEEVLAPPTAEPESN